MTEFKSKQLQDAVIENQIVLRDFMRILDETTEDINMLEKTFRDMHIVVPVILHVTPTRYLEWCRHGKQWRLVCGVDNDRRPLIEAPAAVRMFFKNSLPALVDAVGHMFAGKFSDPEVPK